MVIKSIYPYKLPVLRIWVLQAAVTVLSLLVAAFPVRGNASESATLAITDIKITAQDTYEQIEIMLSRSARHKIFPLASPPRLVVDLPPFLWRVPEKSLHRYNGTLINNVRFARFNANTSRLVFDLNSDIEIKSPVLPGKNKTIRLVIGKKGVSTHYPVPVAKPVRTHKPLIVIDPGHGGKDPGAIGRGKTKEKDVTLKYARALRDKLLRSGRYRVVLTRSDDRSVRLRHRIHIARKAGAKLFISLHADSAPNRRTRGLSVYTLSEKASDQEAAALATRENKADIIVGIDLSHESEDVMDILIDLAQRETKNKSIKFANILVRKLKKSINLLPNTHRFAGFAVLKAPDVPSVLVEIGFLSNPKEEKNIKRKKYMAKVVGGIAKAVDEYFIHSSRKSSP